MILSPNLEFYKSGHCRVTLTQSFTLGDITLHTTEGRFEIGRQFQRTGDDPTVDYVRHFELAACLP